MNRRVAGVDRDSVRTMLRLHGEESLSRHVERMLPAYFVPPRPIPNDRSSQPVGISMDVSQRNGLRTDVAARKFVVRVAANAEYAFAIGLDENAAHRFAQRACAGALRRLHHTSGCF